MRSDSNLLKCQLGHLVLFLYVRRIKIKNVSTAARCSFHHYKKKAMFFFIKITIYLNMLISITC